MSNEERAERLQKLAEQLESSLMAQYGPVVGGAGLRQALGYSSPGAFRQAVHKGTVPVEIFPIENRRGKFALTRDIANWLASQRLQKECTDG